MFDDRADNPLAKTAAAPGLLQEPLPEAQDDLLNGSSAVTLAPEASIEQRLRELQPGEVAVLGIVSARGDDSQGRKLAIDPAPGQCFAPRALIARLADGTCLASDLCPEKGLAIRHAGIARADKIVGSTLSSSLCETLVFANGREIELPPPLEISEPGSPLAPSAGRTTDTLLRSLAAGQALLIGSDPPAGAGQERIVSANPRLSPIHAVLVSNGDGTFDLRDLESANGTVIKGLAGEIELTGASRRVGPGDRIYLGGSQRGLLLEIPFERAESPDEAAHARLEKVRSPGAPGIRGEEELTIADICNEIYRQLDHFLPSTVEGIIEYHDNKESARAVLAKASEWGSYDSLGCLRDAMAPHLENGYKLYRDIAANLGPTGCSLADNLHYLCNRKGSFAPFELTYELNDRAIVILDEVMIDRIERDKQFAAEIMKHDVILLNPQGFDSGINLFDRTGPDDIHYKLTGLMHSVAEELIHRSCDLNSAIEAVLDRPLKDCLARACPELAWARVQNVSPRAIEKRTWDLSSEEIARQLNGKQGISYTDLQQVLERFEESDQAIVKELLAQNTHIYSHRSIAQAVRGLRDRILEAATENLDKQGQQRPIPEDRIFYYLPRFAKSNGMIAMAYRCVNDIAPDRFICSPEELERRQLDHQKDMLVVLDDISGSGESLEDIHRALRGGMRPAFTGRLALAPVLATSLADHLFKGLERKDGMLSWLPGKVTVDLEGSTFYNGLDRTMQGKVSRLVGRTGYDDSALFVSFGYMTPDNNAGLFCRDSGERLGDSLAAHSTINGNGVKS